MVSKHPEQGNLNIPWGNIQKMLILLVKLAHVGFRVTHNGQLYLLLTGPLSNFPPLLIGKLVTHVESHRLPLMCLPMSQGSALQTLGLSHLEFGVFYAFAIIAAHYLYKLLKQSRL